MITHKISIGISLFLLLVPAFFIGDLYARERDPGYCTAVLPCPVLNTSEFSHVFGGKSGITVKKDAKGLVRELELIALPGTVFEITARIPQKGSHIFRVKTAEYPSEKALYIDSRFVQIHNERPPERSRDLPTAKEILSQMKKMLGFPYMWGGNWARGIPEMINFYPPEGPISDKELSIWKLKGVDCSGLIYQASGGNTPRNTSEMVNFGKGISIEGLNSEQIARETKPLDLIVWPGHVIIVFSDSHVIESSLSEGGVIMSDLHKKLSSLMKVRTPANKPKKTSEKYFVIRRWYPE